MSKEIFYTVPQLSKELAITERAIRFYESKGLINQVGQEILEFLIIKIGSLINYFTCKKLGFSLKEIKTYLDLYEVDPSQKVQSKNALEAISHRLFQLEDQKKEINIIIKELKSLKNDIVKTLNHS